MTTFAKYNVWRRHHYSPSGWFKTSHTVSARTPDEAQSKVRRMFKNCGLSSMGLVAIPDGIFPKKDSDE